MLLFFPGRSRECPIWQALYNQVSFCKGFWSKKITYKLEEKHVTQQHSKQHPGSKSGNIWQFVHGEKPVIFNSYKESDWGLSPALEFCFTKHESVLSEHFTAKAFLCRLAGHWSCLAGHVLWYLSTNSFLFDLSTTKQHRMSPDSKVLLWCSNLRNLTHFFFFTGKEMY